jgi:hypothetical protein
MEMTDDADELELDSMITGCVPILAHPADFAWQPSTQALLTTVDQGYSVVIDSVIPHFESQAAWRLRHEWGNAGRKSYPIQGDDYEQWRDWWFTEVSQYCSTRDAATDESTPLSTVEQAAINIFIVAFHLRLAIEQGQSEKAAYLGITMLAESLLIGYELQHSTALDDVTAALSSRRIAYKKGIGRNHDDFAKAKFYATSAAKRIWECDGTLKISKVAENILADLKSRHEEYSEKFDMPDEPTVKKWIREAGALGELAIPNIAQRPGRPPKQK